MMTMDFNKNSKQENQEKQKRRMSLIEIAKEEVEQAQNHPQSNSRENCVNFANQFFDKLKNFANKVCSKNQKDSEEDIKLTKYDMTDFLIHNEELYQEFKELLAQDNIVTHVAVNQELNKFLLEKVEKIMLELKNEATASEKKALSSSSSDTTAECTLSDEDDRVFRRGRRPLRAASLNASISYDDGSIASSANDSTSTKRSSWENLFEKMKKRNSLRTSNDTFTNADFWDSNNTVTGIAPDHNNRNVITRINRSLSEDGPTTGQSILSKEEPQQKTLFRDDSFLSKLTAANIIPSSVNVEKNNDKFNQTRNVFDEDYDCNSINRNNTERRHTVSSRNESAAFQKMRKRLSAT